jgi:hypothetical protein
VFSQNVQLLYFSLLLFVFSFFFLFFHNTLLCHFHFSIFCSLLSFFVKSSCFSYFCKDIFLNIYLKLFVFIFRFVFFFSFFDFFFLSFIPICTSIFEHIFLYTPSICFASYCSHFYIDIFLNIFLKLVVFYTLSFFFFFWRTFFPDFSV